MNKILIIDDDKDMLDFLKDLLESKGYSVCIISDPFAACLYSDLNVFDLIVLDVMMPLMNGFEFFKEVKNNLTVPIIFLSAADSDDAIVKGLNLGAEDYLLKPFSNKVLLAKIENILRRNKKKTNHNIYQTQGLTINLAKKEVSYKDINLELTKTEFMLLATLSARPGKTFTKEELYYRILEFDSDTEIRVITQYVYQLRNKLKECNINPIRNIWGIGYRWVENQ